MNQGIIGQQYASRVVDKTPFQNPKTSPLQVEDLPQQILINKNSSAVLPEERNTILDDVTS